MMCLSGYSRNSCSPGQLIGVGANPLALRRSDALLPIRNGYNQGNVVPPPRQQDGVLIELTEPKLLTALHDERREFLVIITSGSLLAATRRSVSVDCHK